MTSLDEIRQAVVTDFQTAHAVSYSSTLVNYPNLVVVDLDHQQDPFVSVEMELSRVEQTGISERDIMVHGILRAYYYYRIGTGVSGGYQYLDSLNTTLGAKLIGSLYYQPGTSLIVHTFPGWQGNMCSFRFDFVKGLIC